MLPKCGSEKRREAVKYLPTMISTGIVYITYIVATSLVIKHTLLYPPEASQNCYRVHLACTRDTYTLHRAERQKQPVVGIESGMSVNVNVPERDLDPEELELEQDEAFGEDQLTRFCPRHQADFTRFVITGIIYADIHIDLDREYTVLAVHQLADSEIVSGSLSLTITELVHIPTGARLFLRGSRGLHRG